MHPPFSLYKSKVDGFVTNEFIERILSGINRKEEFSTCTALFSPVDTPREAMLNRCRERSDTNLHNEELRRLCWLPPFRCWEMFTIGNLSLALLWHIHRSLPPQVLADEKVIYTLGKISVTLPTLTGNLPRTGSMSGFDRDRHAAITANAFPPDKKSSVSSIFSACEQISELSEMFRSLGNQIAKAGNFDALVIPIVDIDQCLPEQATALLFAIRNFICSDTISLIISADPEILSNFLISIYDNSLNHKQSSVSLSVLFDDRVYLPSPNLEKLIQVIDNSLDKKDIHKIIKSIASSGILCRMDNPTMLHRAIYRYNSFIDSTLINYKRDDHIVGLLLFLLGTIDPETVRTLSILPDLQQLINTIRTNFSGDENDPSGESSNEDPTETVAYTTVPSGAAEEFPERYRTLLLKNSNLLTNVLISLPKTVSDETVARWIVDSAPFS